MVDERHELYHYIGKMIKDARETSDGDILKLIKNLVVNDYLKIMFYLSIPYAFRYEHEEINNFLASGNTNTADVLIYKIKNIFMKCKNKGINKKKVQDILLHLRKNNGDIENIIYEFYVHILNDVYTTHNGGLKKNKKKTKKQKLKARK